MPTQLPEGHGALAGLGAHASQLLALLRCVDLELDLVLDIDLNSSRNASKKG